MHNFVHDMLHDSPAAQRMLALWQVGAHLVVHFPTVVLPIWVGTSAAATFINYDLLQQEYEEGKTDEARFVKGAVQYLCGSD